MVVLELKEKPINDNYLLLEVYFEQLDGEYKIVNKRFPLEEMNNSCFLEFLLWALSGADTEYKDWFNEFISIPKVNDKPLPIDRCRATKILNGVASRIQAVWSEE